MNDLKLLAKEYLVLDKKIKELKEEKEKIKTTIVDKIGYKTEDLGFLKITKIDARVVKKINEKQLKADGLYNKYLTKETQYKESYRIKVDEKEVLRNTDIKKEVKQDEDDELFF